MDKEEFVNFQITGDISVKPIPPHSNVPSPSYRYLIMGPTGSGKSTFVEAFADASQQLSISKDQLSGYTQNVTPYQLMNVRRQSVPVYLIDTPGFSDTKISELEIMDMVQAWFMKNDYGRDSFIDRVLFLTPITDIRIAGSKRRTIKMVNELLKTSRDGNGVIFVTTMWDTIHNERTRQRAESNFEELKNSLFKDFIDEGCEIAQFWNTKSSALKVLDTSIKHVTTFSGKTSIRLPNLYHDLYERIEGALQQKWFIDSELAQLDDHSNPALKDLLLKIQDENDETLTKFIIQFNHLGLPPAGLEERHNRLSSALQSITYSDPHLVKAIQSIAHEQRPQSPDPTETSPPLIDVAPEPFPPTSSAGAVHPPASLTQADDAPVNVITTEPVLPRSSRDVHPPNSLAQADAIQTLVMKGLVRRLIHAAKRRGNKWFGKSKD